MPSVSCSFSSACLLAGRHEVKQSCGGPLVQYFNLGDCLGLALLVVHCVVSVAESEHELGFLGSHLPKASSRGTHPMQFRHSFYKN